MHDGQGLNSVYSGVCIWLRERMLKSFLLAKLEIILRICNLLRCFTKPDRQTVQPPSMSSIQLNVRNISAFSEEYKKRRRQQMMRFFGATAFTLISARLAFRGVQARKCMMNYARSR